MNLHVFPIPIPPPTSLPIPSLWVFPVHQPWALVSCIQPGLAICFTLGSTLVSVLFSQNIPPSPRCTEQTFELFFKWIPSFIFYLIAVPQGLFVPWPGIELEPLAVEAWSANYWTAREFPKPELLNQSKFWIVQCDKKESCSGMPWLHSSRRSPSRQQGSQTDRLC